MKYKIGQKVRVKQEIHNPFDGPNFTYTMEKFKGQKVEIFDIPGEHRKDYLAGKGEERWSFLEEWLEPIENKYIAQYIRDNRVSIKVDNKEQADLLINHFKKLYPQDYAEATSYNHINVYRFYLRKGSTYDYFGCISGSYATAASSSLKSNEEIHFNEFNFETENKMNIERPKTFWCKGKPHHIEAFSKDLEELGYTIRFADIEKGEDYLILGNNINSKQCDKNSYKEILKANHVITKRLLNFTLPEDYSKALEHAKEAINSPYWDVKKEAELTLSNGKTVVVGTRSIIAENKDIAIGDLISIESPTLNQVGDWSVSLTDATYTIGCWKDVKLSDIQLIIEKYNEINP